jgi:hypothetical protein
MATLLGVALVISACDARDTTPAPAPEPARLATLTIAAPGPVSDGDVIPLVTTARDQYGATITDASITWSSSNLTVATISPTGVLTAFREGQTELRAIARRDDISVEQRLPLTVSLHPAMRLELNRDALELPVGTNATTEVVVRGMDGRILQNRPVTYRSDNPTVAVVGPDGTVRALAGGTARIIAEYGTLRDTLVVTVPTPVPTSTRYRATTVNGSTTIPAVVDDDTVIGADGQPHRYITRIDSAAVTVGVSYSITVFMSLSERWELQGNVIERVISRSTVRDEGTVSYNWFTNDATLVSTKVGGLSHQLALGASPVVLSFREPGSIIPWVFTLVPRTTP